jgi:tetratricopeptide (TPR) repeat protein
MKERFMAKRKLKKEEMRTDPFRKFLGKVFSTTELSLEHHWQAYIAALIVVIAAVSGIYYYIDYANQKKETASVLLSEVMDISQAPVLQAGDPQRADYLKAGLKVYTSQDERSADLKKKIDELDAKGASRYQEKTALYLKASDFARSGSYPDALKILDELEKDSVFKSSALELKARIYEAQNDSAKAESIYTQLSTLNSGNFPEPMGLSILAQFYERQGKKDEARKTCEEALKIIASKKEKPAVSKEPGPQPQPQKDSMESRLKDKVKELKT